MQKTIALAGIGLVGLLILVPLVFAGTARQAETPPEVLAEALGRANLRSGPGTEFDQVGEITNGTRYRVRARHEFVPWVLLEVPQLRSGGGWVFQDLVAIRQGDLFSVPLLSDFQPLPADGGGFPPAAPVEAPSGDATSDGNTAAATAPVSAPTQVNLVTATLQGRSNLRYGPGVDYPTITTLDGGAVMVVLARHSNFPWLKVAIEGAPNGEGWVLQDLVNIQGDIFTLPVINDLQIPFPTPSATPDTVVSNAPALAIAFDTADSSALRAALGVPLHEYLLSQGVAPRTDKEASLFVLDLRTSQHFTLNGGVAYSGMSINKIPILVRYFLQRSAPLQTTDAELVATTMLCSENITTNRMLTTIGDGDIMLGTQRVTEMMSQLGLGNTFISAPFFAPMGSATPTPAPAVPITTNADQASNLPDRFNQLTVEDLGWLLTSVYQCAADGSGPLVETFGTLVDQRECRQMLRVMSGNKVGRLIERGVPPGTTLAHKHGWVDDTRGDAGIVLTPQGAYVLVMAYHERTTFADESSFFLLEEVARRVWNHFNPAQPLAGLQSPQVPAECNIYGEPVISDMLANNVVLPGLPRVARLPGKKPARPASPGGPGPAGVFVCHRAHQPGPARDSADKASDCPPGAR
ncbi:MAG: SH3 domain-containing protein [Anaerolineae bacterium]|nr:SH3 domain-containing protein [Anaerolineae bacterium]